ncbi:uncharacterized protein MONOS_8093 [Monocercomonoides exilis]|uniref:uncharacterized protein n=1 Tax=Monocercomonoides exilis TaxID=2049356 RepID=UPI0035594AC9|nr:hypothetical protein MONOS_8093 [Monocercomonoides exilis]|eukprot:MONOS_8093.1-p1 / transcript=MONOS_8093.1 / gene=MONOS_8093 / organism=Monocercomonoides_exilis_PA203 / gene_product=unspecified product / transcript_product=unspecified product / location=Mono_scaffold00295:65024-69233(+) / protein_length=1243 / sequence_SO=supercontig / SO=protein_coding / is_pseudo=false
MSLEVIKRHDDISDIDEISTFYNKLDFNPVVGHSPPTAVRTEYWYRDALEKAGEQVERYLFPAFKAILLSIQNIKKKAETAEEVAKDALMLITQAMQEARKMRIQGRYGFTAARKMEAEATEKHIERCSQEVSAEGSFFGGGPGRQEVSIASEAPREEQGRLGRRVLQDVPGETGNINGDPREDWRQDSSVFGGMGQNLRRKPYKTGRTRFMDKQKSKGSTEEEILGGWSYAHEHGTAIGFQKRVERTTGDKHCQRNTSRTGQLSEQCLSHQEEVRRLAPNPGLPSCECCNEKVAFQIRKRTDGRTFDRKERLCDNIGSFPGVFLITSIRLPEAVSLFLVRRTRLCFRSHALRLYRCPSVFHKDNEESDSSDKGKMESQSGFFLGRSYSVALRQQLTEEKFRRSNSVFKKTRITHQHREMSAGTNTEVCVLGVPLEHRRLFSSIERGKAFFSQSDVESMESEGNKSQNSSNKGFCLSNWKAQRSKIRIPGCVTSPYSSSSSPAEEREDIRMELCDEDECFSVEGDSGVAMDIEPESTENITTSVYSPGCVNDRCCGNSMGCNIQSEQQHYGLARQVPQLCPKPIIQLQRTTSCFASASPFFSNNSKKQNNSSIDSFGQQLSYLQRESLERRQESSSSASQDMEMGGGEESDNKSTTSPRKKEPQSGCAVSIGKGRRIRNKGRSTQRDSCTVESETDSRCFCIGTQSQSGKMVWSGQSNCRRRIDSSDGESSSDYTPDELEGSELGHPSSNEQLLQLGIELQLQDSSGGAMDEEDGSLSSSREDESNPAESIKERGEAWWLHALHERGVSLELAEECKAGISKTTWDGYLFCFAHFSDQWKKCAHGHIPDNLPDWTIKCADVFLTMKNRGFKVSVIQMERAAVSFYSVLAFNSALGDIAIIRILFRAFRRNDISRKKMAPEIWNPDVLLKYFTELGPNNKLSFKTLTMKVITLTMLFSACRFTELERVNMENSRFEEEGVYLDTVLKTSHTRSEIAVPFLPDLPLICPASAIKDLYFLVKQKQNSNKLLLNTTTFEPLTASGIRKLAKEAMKLTGVPQRFKLYSLKAATLSTLTMAGIPPLQIAKFARLSPKTNTPAKHYFRTNLASSMAQEIAGTMKAQKTGDCERDERLIVSDEEEEKREQANEGTLSEKESMSEEIEASMQELVEDVKTKTVRLKRTKGKKWQIQGEDDRTSDVLNVEQHKQEEENDIFIIRTRAQAKRESKTYDFRSFDRSPKAKATASN